MKLKMTFDEWYKEVVRLMTLESTTPPERHETRYEYEAGKNPQEAAQQYILYQSSWNDTEGDDPFIE